MAEKEQLLNEDDDKNNDDNTNDNAPQTTEIKDDDNNNDDQKEEKQEEKKDDDNTDNKNEEEKKDDKEDNEEKKDDKEEKKEDKKENVDEKKDDKEVIEMEKKGPMRPSIVITPADIPQYDANRRMSQLEMKEMKSNIEQMTQALIQNPKAAVRRYSQHVTDEKTIKEEEKDDNPLLDDTQKNMNKIDEDDDRRKLPPLGFKQICLGLSPVWFCIVLGIFALIVYGIANYPDDKVYEAGPYGDWSTWGGNSENQQQVPNGSYIDSSNIDDIEYLCDFDAIYPDDFLTNSLYQDSNYGMYGFIATDKGSSNGFYVDNSGYVTSINLNDCSLNWIVSIANVTNFEDVNWLSSHNGLSLYQDSMGRKAVLVGGPNYNGDNMTLCYILSLDQSDGTLLWKQSFTASGSSEECKTDGFVVDDHYGYGGIYADHDENIGEFIKIDLDNDGEIVARWNSLPEISVDNLINDEFYSGAAPMNWASILNEYVVFGTGSLYRNPQSINDCLMGLTPAPTKSSPDNPCGDDKSNYPHWNCYENDVYSDSINIFNKSSLNHVKSIPLQGNDLFNDECNIYSNAKWDNDTCGGPSDIAGPNGDVIAIAQYMYLGEQYVASFTQSGMFYVFTVPDGELVIAKKIGKAGINGGGLYSLALSEEHMIAILSYSGGNTPYRNRMANGLAVCQTGFIEAIDLTTGWTKWQLLNPYGVLGVECELDANYDLPDYSINEENGGGQVCNIGFEGTGNLATNITARDSVNEPDVINGVISATSRSWFLAPASISNDLVFLPSLTGDLWIVDIANGEIIDTKTCKQRVNANGGEYNRAGFASGVTVIRDRLIFYCGSAYHAKTTQGKQIYSYKLMDY